MPELSSAAVTAATSSVEEPYVLANSSLERNLRSLSGVFCQYARSGRAGAPALGRTKRVKPTFWVGSTAPTSWASCGCGRALFARVGDDAMLKGDLECPTDN